MSSLGDSIYNNDYINIDGNHIHNTAIVERGVVLGKGNIIHPFVHIGAIGANKKNMGVGNVRIGNNNQIYSFVKIANNVTIGNSNIIMSHTNIGHDCVIQDENEIGVNTLIMGHVTIGSKNAIKGSCSIRNRLLIGNATVIGMGSVVVKDVPNGLEIKGNPAR